MTTVAELSELFFDNTEKVRIFFRLIDKMILEYEGNGDVPQTYNEFSQNFSSSTYNFSNITLSDKWVTCFEKTVENIIKLSEKRLENYNICSFFREILFTFFQSFNKDVRKKLVQKTLFSNPKFLEIVPYLYYDVLQLPTPCPILFNPPGSIHNALVDTLLSNIDDLTKCKEWWAGIERQYSNQKYRYMESVIQRMLVLISQIEDEKRLQKVFEILLIPCGIIEEFVKENKNISHKTAFLFGKYGQKFNEEGRVFLRLHSNIQ